MLPAHITCNTEYGRDEEYVLMLLGPLAHGTGAGALIWKDISTKSKRSEGHTLLAKVLAEFDYRHGGLYLPNNIVAKKYDPRRVRRVMWKIARGLHFDRTGDFYPDDYPIRWCVCARPQDIPQSVRPFCEGSLVVYPRCGDYPDVFLGREIDLGPQGAPCIYSDFLLWQAVLVIVMWSPRHDDRLPGQAAEKSRL